MKFSIYLFSISLLFCACEQAPEKNLNFLKDENLSISEKLETYLASDGLMKRIYNKDEVSFLKSLYNELDNGPIIAASDSTYTREGKQLKEMAMSPLAYGVPNELCLEILDSLHPIENELRCMINISRILTVQKEGFFNFETKTKKSIGRADISLFKRLLSSKSKAKKSALVLRQGPVRDTVYSKLSSKIYEYSQKYLLDTANIKVKKNQEIKANPKRFAIQSLRAKGYMDQNVYSQSEYESSLLSFKIDNGLDSTTELNDYTIEALAESNTHRLTRAAISLDKVRQHKPYGDRYVRINIPEYNLYFFANDSLKAVHRVVVGKRDTQTPELTSEIRTIIVYPYWKVPASIIKKEIMPDVYRNPGYLGRHHYKLCKFDDTSRIDPSKINWKNRPGGFSVIQMPGPWNSLGVIKFEFLSNHSVYVHDTPQKGFFNRKVRSFSHGCMRCQYPVELGKLMLLYDQKGRRRKSMPMDTLDSLVRIGEHKAIALKTRIPIFVEYQTVTTYNDHLIFHLDIYFREEELIKILKPKPEATVPKKQQKRNS